MNVTGLIYLAIIGLWAVVLLPMWLRRHDDAQSKVRLDRHGSAMGALAQARDDDELQGEALLRRRRLLVMLALTGFAGLVLLAWGMGFARGWMAVLAALPALGYATVVVLSRRVQERDASRRAKERSRAARLARRGAHAPRRASTAIHPQRTSSTRPVEASRSVSVVRPATGGSARPQPHERIFDQTA